MKLREVAIDSDGNFWEITDETIKGYLVYKAGLEGKGDMVLATCKANYQWKSYTEPFREIGKYKVIGITGCGYISEQMNVQGKVLEVLDDDAYKIAIPQENE